MREKSADSSKRERERERDTRPRREKPVTRDGLFCWKEIRVSKEKPAFRDETAGKDFKREINQR